MNLHQLSVTSKLTGAFGILAVIVLIVSGVALKATVIAFRVRPKRSG
jgi:phosphoglycerate-specific signal transduction histidine kinase